MNKIIYYLLGLNTLIYMFNMSTVFFNSINLRTLNFFIYLVCLSVIFLKRNLKKEEIYLLIFDIFLLFITKRLYLSLIIILALVIDVKTIKEYYRINLIFLSFGLFLIILLAKFNVIDNFIWSYNIYGYIGIQKREALGFLNPNFPSLIFWIIRISFYYLKYERLKIYHFFIFGILSLMLYYQTYSRTLIILYILEIILYYFFRHLYKYLKKILKFIPIIYMIFLFSSIYFFKESILNKILSYRLSYSYKFLKSINIYELIVGNRNNFQLPLDISFISLIHDYGIFIVIIITSLFYLGLKNLILFEEVKNSKKLSFIFMLYLLYSISESIFFSPYFSLITSVLIKYSYLFKNKKSNS